MHIFDNERAKSEDVVKQFDATLRDKPSDPMPPMPADPSPLEQAYELARLEARLRHDHSDLHRQNDRDLLKRGSDNLDPYWLAFYRVLLSHALIRAGREESAKLIAQQLPTYFRAGVEFQIRTFSNAQRVAPGEQRTLGIMDDHTGTKATKVADAFRPTLEEERQMLAQLDGILDDLEIASGQVVTRNEARVLRKRLIENRVAVAARSEDDESAGPLDRNLLSRGDVEAELSQIRSTHDAT
jgi:hypothetical protein